MSDKPIPLVRVERDTNTAVYRMGRPELVTAAVHGKGAIRDQAREELAIREWNKLVKKAHQ